MGAQEQARRSEFDDLTRLTLCAIHPHISTHTYVTPEGPTGRNYFTTSVRERCVSRKHPTFLIVFFMSYPLLSGESPNFQFSEASLPWRLSMCQTLHLCSKNITPTLFWGRGNFSRTIICFVVETGLVSFLSGKMIPTEINRCIYLLKSAANAQRGSWCPAYLHIVYVATLFTARQVRCAQCIPKAQRVQPQTDI